MLDGLIMPSHEVSIVVKEAYFPPFRVKQIRATEGPCVLKHRIEFGFLLTAEIADDLLPRSRMIPVLGYND